MKYEHRLMEEDIKGESNNTEGKAIKVVNERIIASVGISTGICIEAKRRGVPIINFRFGGMLSGKTEGTIRDMIALEEEGITTHVFKVKGDDRYVSTTDQVGSKCGIAIEAVNIRSIVEVTEMIRSGIIRTGDAIGLVELPFMCESVQDYDEFEEKVRRNGIIVSADGLGFWFNTKPLEIVERILGTADKAFYMQAWNSFDPETLADATLRCVKVVMFNGEVNIIDEDGIFYRSLEREHLMSLIQVFTDSEFYRDNLTVHQALIQSGYGRTVLLPSHPNDPLFAIGGPERYIPISLRNMLDMYEELGIILEITDPQEIVRRYEDVHDWGEEGLVI